MPLRLCHASPLTSRTASPRSSTGTIPQPPAEDAPLPVRIGDTWPAADSC